ncbi:MAG: hypothetical protein B7Y25_07500 [Alphaproteobacteria bacterium 16-39-46]|nr:MAG: hypothetical protein B7Y25_07500 [Alphaproteobacteria bacterium 16-39-46]OZA41644.1 MAG: hypothetical protein B7X84_07655 [Alphaproteobacteria bacterium 17-39-52]
MFKFKPLKKKFLQRDILCLALFKILLVVGLSFYLKSFSKPHMTFEKISKHLVSSLKQERKLG